MTYNELVGEHIEAVEIFGQHENEEQLIVEADVMLDVQRVGACALTVMTKGHHRDVTLGEYLEELDSLDRGVIPGEAEEGVEPYVINEDSITPDLLREKFLHQSVWDGLAKCLVPQVNGTSG